MRVTKYFFFSISMVLLLISCGKDLRFWKHQSGDLIAEVGEEQLYEDAMMSHLNLQGVASEDSTEMQDFFIREWITDRLLYNKALTEIEDMDVVDSLVDVYRRSLVIYEYELQLVNEHLRDRLTDAQIRSFYKENPQMFVMSEGLVKGMLLVTRSNVPDLQVMESMMTMPSEDNIDLISSISVKNSANFDYFVNRWVPISEVRKNSPLPIMEENLHKGKLCTVSDSIHTIFFYVSEYVKAGELQPYDYAQPRIKTVLLEQKKHEFLQEYTKNLYELGIRKGHAKRYK